MVILTDDAYEVLKKSVTPEILASLKAYENCVVPDWIQRDHFIETEIMDDEMWKWFSSYAQRYYSEDFSITFQACVDSFFTFAKKVNEEKKDGKIFEFLKAYQKIKSERE